ncbi:uncharacterized protein LOC113852574 [Abrus precatorius]|uniref:Uncharacterized protein LOC113852574 n=1 Tax=Abrus precatorius TaxID=3816 RepID=A0A8B8K4V1_ABRPR|nr:uncharacterized protein LOC113852574 [Abrus precatorius]
MAGFLAKAKRLYPKTFAIPSMSVSIRHRSTKPEPQLVQVDMAEYDVTLKLFDDLIHRILVKKATPDWLPFVPGSSFWVPPRPSPSKFVDLVHKLTNDAEHSLSQEESLFLATLRGWPSSNFYIQDNANTHGGDTDVEVNSPEGMEGTVKVKVLTFSENVAHSEDEEG